MPLFRRKRPDEASALRALAEELGLEYADRVDDAGLAGLGELPDLPLLREGNAASIHRLLYGRLDDTQVRLFDFLITGYSDEGSRIARSCMLFLFDRVGFPDIYLSPRARLPRLGEKISDAGVALGSPELMARYKIQARSRVDASDLIEPELEHWLIDCPLDDLRIEMNDGALLGHVPDVPGADELRQLLAFMRGFRDRIPERFWATHRRF